jgi:hypothetical protein
MLVPLISKTQSTHSVEYRTGGQSNDRKDGTPACRVRLTFPGRSQRRRYDRLKDAPRKAAIM